MERVLCVDVGGAGVKGMVVDRSGAAINERVRIKTPRPATPDAVLDAIVAVAEVQPPFDGVAVGLPGVVQGGVALTAPNLDGDWREVPVAAEVARRVGRPCRAANDADIQGYGAISGRGVEMVLTLGTGLGSAIFTNGHLVPNLELGHHPWTDGKTYEQLLGRAARKRLGHERWSARVLEALAQIRPIWNPQRLYLGGGNAKKLEVDLPQWVERVPNVAGILGGVRLWQDEPH